MGQAQYQSEKNILTSWTSDKNVYKLGNKDI